MADDGGERGRATLRAIFELLRRPDLEPEEKVVWGLYRSYESPSGKGAYPGDDLLAEHLDRSPRTVRRYRKQLLDKGFLRQKLQGPQEARYWTQLPEREEGDDSDDSDSDPFDPDEWLDAVEQSDSPLASDALPAGIRPLLWAGPSPPDDAPDGWSIRAEIGHLAQLTSNGWPGRDVGLAMIGLYLMGEAGEVPKQLTSGYPTSSREWEGPELWRAARDRGREWASGRSGMDGRVADLLEGGET